MEVKGDINYKYFFTILTASILFPLGVFFANSILPKKHSCGSFGRKNINYVKITQDHMGAYILVFLLCIYLFIKYTSIISGFAFINNLSNIGAGSNLIAFRQNITTRLVGWHWYCMVFYSILPFLATYTYMQYRLLKNMRTFIPFFLFFVLALLTTTLSGHKGPVLMMLIMMWGARIKIAEKIYFRNFIKMFIVGFVLLILFYISIIGIRHDIVNSVILSVSLIFDRITLAYTNTLNTLLNIFPTHHDFLWGTSLPNPRRIFSFEPFNLPNFTFLEQRMIYDISNVGSSPTVFFGEFYANFGFIIMSLSVYVMGILLSLIQFFFNRTPKTTLTYCFFMIIAVRVICLACGSFTNLFGPILILLSALYGYLKFFPLIIQHIVAKGNRKSESSKPPKHLVSSSSYTDSPSKSSA